MSKNLSDMDLNAALKILKSPLGKAMIPILKGQMQDATKMHIKDYVQKDDRTWTVDEAMADIVNTSPKMLEIYKLVGISKDRLREIVTEALA